MPNYNEYGNEKLLPLAIEGDAGAEQELNDRGNTLELDEEKKPTGGLLKVYRWVKRNHVNGKLISENQIVETVRNGKRISVTVDGKEVQAEVAPVRT